MNNIVIKTLNKQFSVKDLKKTLHIDKNDILYIGGSLIEGEYNSLSIGMGNPKSDLDLFIIKEGDLYSKIDCEYEFKNKKVDFKIVNGIDFDIEFFIDKDIDKVIKCIDNINYDINERVSNMISPPEGWNFDEINGFLTRIYYAQCIYNEEAFSNIKKQLQFNLFNKLHCYLIINTIENIIDDVLGNLEIGQLGTALYGSRNAFLYFMKFIILSEKEFIDRDKWIILKFFNIAKQKEKYKDIVEEYNKLFLEDMSNNLVLENTVQSSVNFIQRKIEDMMLGDII